MLSFSAIRKCDQRLTVTHTRTKGSLMLVTYCHSLFTRRKSIHIKNNHICKVNGSYFPCLRSKTGESVKHMGDSFPTYRGVILDASATNMMYMLITLFSSIFANIKYNCAGKTAKVKLFLGY